MRRFNIGGFYYGKIRRLFLSIFKKNTPPEKLALALTLGITVGIIPFFGFIAVIISIIALNLKLNIVAVNFAYYIVHPLQLALFIPFFKMGKLFHNGEFMPASFKQFIVLLKTDFWETFQSFWLANISAIGVWLIISIPLSLILYYTFIYLLKKRLTLKSILVK